MRLRSLVVLLALGWSGAVLAQEPELKLVAEAKLATILKRPGERFEASAVFAAPTGIHVLFDNRRDIAIVASDLSTGRLKPLRTTWPGTDFEGLTWDAQSQRFFAAIEAERVGRAYRSRLIELDAGFQEQGSWSLTPDLAHPGKGVEGLAHVRRGGKLYILAQLEGNHGLGGKRGKDKGNGRVRVYARDGAGWTLTATLKLPPTARVSDYAGLDVTSDGRIAVVSQKTAKVWIGRLAQTGWKVAGEGTLYRFPRPNGEKIYESVEGVTWFGKRRLVFSSDGARSKTGLPKSESLHIFDLP